MSLIPIKEDDNKQNFIIMMGIPGVGKSTFAKRLAATLPDSTIIRRDEIRFELLQELKQQGESCTNLDRRVDDIEGDRVTDEIYRKHHKYVILDGCHTNFRSTLYLLAKIKLRDADTTLTVICVGDEFSKTCYTTNQKKDDDYSDFRDDGTFDYIPKVVLERKREELSISLTENFAELRFACNAFHLIPSYP